MMNKTADGARIERLNLAISYPVRWSAYTVLRDFIQNFFDSIGPEKFGQEFEYSYDQEGRTLSMRSGKGFALDWLMYMGASSKRGDGARKAVGKFGEGFKIASLCAHRDLKWSVRMASRDWVVHVIETPDEIAGQSMPLLAYEVSEQEYREEATLILTGVKAEDYTEAFRWALEDFWYPESPVLGDQIASGDGWTVHRPGVGSRGRDGALYVGYLRRAFLDEPIIVCNHGYNPEDGDEREREDFHRAEVDECLLDVVRRMQPTDALVVLETIPRRWDGRSRRRDSGYAWPCIVRELIKKVAEDEGVTQRFLATHKDNLLADFPQASMDTNKHAAAVRSNRRGLALLWWRRSSLHGMRLVMNDFEKLGVLELDGVCEYYGGYERLREPDDIERQRIDVLERAAVDIFGVLLCYPDGLPPTKIILNRPPVEGTAHFTPTKGKRQNKVRMTVKYEIKSIQLRVELLQPGKFPEALATYMHECLHQYGGDEATQFRRALSLMASRMYVAADEIFMYESTWDAIKEGCDGEDA